MVNKKKKESNDDFIALKDKIKKLRISLSSGIPKDLDSEKHFACFLGALLAYSLQNKPKNGLDLCVFLRLLSDALSKVSKGLLQVKCDAILPLIKTPKTKTLFFEQSAFHVIDCFYYIFSAADNFNLSKPSFKNAMELLTGLAMNSNPKLQSHARKKLSLLLSQLPNKDNQHPQLDVIVSCIQKVLQHHPEGKEHALSLVNSIFNYMTHNEVETFVNIAISFLSRPSLHPLISKLFSKALNLHSHTWALDRVQTLFQFFLDLKPALSDVHNLIAWLQDLVHCYPTLFLLDGFLEKYDLASLLINQVLVLIKSKHTLVLENTALTTSSLLEACFTDVFLQNAMQFDTLPESEECSHPRSVLHQLAAKFSSLFHPFYMHAWGHLFYCLCIFVQVFKHHSRDYTKNLLLQLDNLRNTPGFAYKAEYELFLKSVIRHMGPKFILEYLPLNIGQAGNPQVHVRTYLVNLMELAIQNTELSFFFSYFIPLSKGLLIKKREFHSSSREAKDLDTLYFQIWALLPSFCIFPTDLKVMLEMLILNLKSVFQEQPSLRPILSRAFCNLIFKNQEVTLSTEDRSTNVSFPYSATAAKEYLELLSMVSKEFLPLYFNIFKSMSSGDRSSLTTAIRALVSVATLDVIGILYTELLKFMQGQQPIEFQQTLLELAILLVPRLPTTASVEPFVSIALQAIPYQPFQRSAFKLLQTMLELDLCLEYFNTHLHILETHVLQAEIKDLNPKALRHFFMFLKRALETLKCFQFLPQVGKKAVSGLSVVNSKTRAVSSDLLFYCFMNFEKETMAETILLSFQHMQKESPTTISAFIIVVNRVCYSYGSELSDSFIESLFQVLPSYIEHQSKAIASSILGFHRVLCYKFTIEEIHGYLPSMIAMLSKLAQLMPRGFRPPIRRAFYLIIKKCGYDLIQRLTPDEQQKMIKGIFKNMKRLYRKSMEPPTSEKNVSSVPSSRSSLKSLSTLQSFEDIMYGEIQNDSGDEENTVDNVTDDDVAFDGFNDNEDEVPTDLLDAKDYSQLCIVNPWNLLRARRMS
ncbi:pre-rRNA processing protein, partial [Coelomomyces lativittatus]